MQSHINKVTSMAKDILVPYKNWQNNNNNNDNNQADELLPMKVLRPLKVE